MKYFTFILTLLLSIGITIGLAGQSAPVTIVKTSKGCFETSMCMQSFFRYEENAKHIDTIRAVSTYKCVDEENSLVMHVASWGGDYFCYVNHNGAADWYDAEVLFNTNGIYQINLRHPLDNTHLARIDIGTSLQYNWSPETGAGFKIKLGFPVFMCWSDLPETNCKGYFSLFWKRPGEKQPWQLK